MKIIRDMIFIGSMLYLAEAQTLDPAAIRQINQQVQKLSDQRVNPNEVAVIETEYGRIVFEFYSNVAPLHAMNFKKLAGYGYYDSTLFHRVIPGFIIQGGDIYSRDDDPGNDGTGGPGYTIQAEFGRRHRRGAVAAARKADTINPQRRSSGSQFYICVEPQPGLDSMGYTVFGHVIEGLDVVRKIAQVDRDKRNRPKQNIPMLRVYVTNKDQLNPRN